MAFTTAQIVASLDAQGAQQDEADAVSQPPCTFGVRFHRPAIYRYVVAEHGFRLRRNCYAANGSNAWIGLALVLVQPGAPHERRKGLRLLRILPSLPL